MAIRVFNALSDSMGGVAWAGLEVMAAYYGIDDVDGLIERLLIVKTHRPAT